MCLKLFYCCKVAVKFHQLETLTYNFIFRAFLSRQSVDDFSVLSLTETVGGCAAKG